MSGIKFDDLIKAVDEKLSAISIGIGPGPKLTEIVRLEFENGECIEFIQDRINGGCEMGYIGRVKAFPSRKWL